MAAQSKHQKACTVYPELFHRTFSVGDRHPFLKVPRSDRTRRRLVRQILRELYKQDGPRGFPDEIVLRQVNERLANQGLKPISQSTMRRARAEEYGW